MHKKSSGKRKAMWVLEIGLGIFACGAMTAECSGGADTKEGPFINATRAGRDGLSHSTGNGDKYFFLTNETDFGGALLPPVGNDTVEYKGVFDRNGHILRNGTVWASYLNAGLFANVSFGEILDLDVDGNNNEGYIYLPGNVLSSEKGEGESPEREGEPSVPHPADLNTDFRMVMSEAIAFLAGWQQGVNPMAQAIRAAYLWQQWEYYTYFPDELTPECWVPDIPSYCEGETETRPILVVEPTELHLPGDYGTTNFSVYEYNGGCMQWRVSTNATWMTVQKEDLHQVRVDYVRNNEVYERIGILTIKAYGVDNIPAENSPFHLLVYQAPYDWGEEGEEEGEGEYEGETECADHGGCADIPDPVLEAALRDHIHKPVGAICVDDLRPLRTFIYEPGKEGAKISDLTGIEHCVQLEVFHGDDNLISDLEPLGRIGALREVWIQNNQIQGLEPFREHTNLRAFYAGGNDISFIWPLQSCVNLGWLVISHNAVQNIEALQGLEALTTLDIHDNPVANIDVVEKLPALQYLDASYTEVENIDLLGGHAQLTWLNLRNTQVSLLYACENMPNLISLDVQECPLMDVAVCQTLWILTYQPYPHVSVTFSGTWEDYGCG